MTEEKVNLVLTREEAVVLFDYLGRFNESDDPNNFEEQAEQRILWDLEWLLEKQLWEPFRDDYQDILAKAREHVRDSED